MTTFQNSDNVAHVDITRLCPLSRCIIKKDMDALKRILHERVKNPTQLQKDSRGWTALHVAAFKDEHADCLELLISSKNSLQLNLDAKTLTGKTALYLACRNNCVKNCGILLQSQCNPEISGRNGIAPLHIASKYCDASVVSQLIARGVNTNCLDSRGYTPLHYASFKAGNVEVVRVLMTNKQTKINILSSDGYSPFDVACRWGCLEIMKILLEADRSLLNLYDQCSGFTPLVRVIQSRHVCRVKYLLDQGANANWCTPGHTTTLYHAIDSGVQGILSLVLQATSLTYIQEQFMLEIQCVLSATNKNEFSSLVTYVICYSSWEFLLLLLESRIPQSILEAPHLIKRHTGTEHILEVYSPIAFLFYYAKYEIFEVDNFLPLLLRYNITNLHKFNQMVDLKEAAHTFTIHYIHPFTILFRQPWFPVECSLKRDQYLDMLFEYGITTDYCLQCDVHYDSSFLDFDVKVLKHFYKPVVWAISKANAEYIELLLIHSAILEPYHLWNFLQYRRSVAVGRRTPEKVVNYLIDLGVIVNTSNLPSYPFGGTIKCPNLQQVCRQVIRKHLRDVSIKDNLKNFKKKINALPLPNLLKDYLQFKRR